MQLTFDLPDELAEKIDIIAKDRGLPLDDNGQAVDPPEWVLAAAVYKQLLEMCRHAWIPVEVTRWTEKVRLKAECSLCPQKLDLSITHEELGHLLARELTENGGEFPQYGPPGPEQGAVSQQARFA